MGLFTTNFINSLINNFFNFLRKIKFKSLYGFSPRDAVMFSTLCLAIIFFSYSLIDFENDYSPSLSESANIIDDKPQNFKISKLRKGDNNFASDATPDSLKKSDKKYKAKYA